jgi:ligand-binding sensor domain-containing protein
MMRKCRGFLFLFLEACLVAPKAASQEGGTPQWMAWRIDQGEWWKHVDPRHVRTGIAEITWEFAGGDITAIGQDTEGRLLVATHFLPVVAEKRHLLPINALWRLDGEGFSYFSPYVGPSAPYVNCIATAPDGSIWIGTDDGLIVLQEQTPRIIKAYRHKWYLSTVPDSITEHRLGQVKTVLFHEQNQVWLNGDEPAVVLFLKRLGGPEVEMHQAHMMQRGILSSEVVAHLARTNRQMWAVTNQGNLVSRTGVSVVARSLGPLWKNVAALPEGVKPDQVRFIQGDPAGRIWVVARGGLSDRLFYYDIPGKAWVDCPEVANLVPSGTINAMAVDQTGRAYFSTRWHGIVVFDGQKWTPHPINEYLPHVPLSWLPHDPSETVSQEETQLPAGVATLSSQVFCDREDHLWIGSGVYLIKCPAHWTGEILGEGPAR